MQTLGISLFSSLIDGMSSSMSYEMIDLCLFRVIGKSIYLKAVALLDKRIPLSEVRKW